VENSGVDPSRVAEVLVTRHDGTDWRGSGYRVSTSAVLTAAHVVADARNVRVRFDADRPSEWSSAANPAWEEEGIDVAVLTIANGGERPVPTASYGGLPDVAAVVPVMAVGFPLFKLRRDRGVGTAAMPASEYRDMEQAVGTIALLSNRREGTLDLRVDPPAANPDPARSPWEGMSGAAVWAAGHIVGVVKEHHQTDGLGRLAATRADMWIGHEGFSAQRLGELCDLTGLPRQASGLQMVEPEVTGRPVVAELVSGEGRAVFFAGAYEALDDAYIDPWQVFERTGVDRFVGRAWLERKLDDFLEKNDRGYFILEAGAGLGKSSFLAHLVRERGWIHHFVELAPGPEGVVPARKNLAAQVIRAFELGDQILPDEAAARPDFLASLLRRASGKRHPGERIVLVVDGLDEAAARPGENVLGLPAVLPEGVFFVCSKRPGHIALNVDHPRRVFTIDPQRDENLADMRTYLEEETSRPQVVAALPASHQARGELIDALLASSRGVWIYLHYVIADVEHGHGELDLAALPEGLWGYYEKWWRRWKTRNASEWVDLYRPLLSALAVLQEDVPLGSLCELAGLNQALLPSAETLLDDSWRSFLTVQTVDGQRLYRLYHRSLADFFRGHVEDDDLLEDERDFAEELAAASRQAEARIADRYLASWGGLANGLPGLRDAHIRDLDGGYGLRHLPQHLFGAARHDNLHKLLSLEGSDNAETRTASVWFEVKDQVGDISGYLADVTLAWQAAALASQAEAATGPASSVGLEARYCLLTASVGSMVRNVGPRLLGRLVDTGFWNAKRALAYGLEQPDGPQRAFALARLAPRLPDPERESALRSALAATRAIENEAQRRLALGELAPHLPEPLLIEALDIVETITSREQRETALDDVAPYLTQVLARQLLAEATAIESAGMRAALLTKLAPRLPADEGSPASLQALTAARAISDTCLRATSLAELAPHLPQTEREEAISDALKAFRLTDPGIDRDVALAAVASWLPAAEREAEVRARLAVVNKSLAPGTQLDYLIPLLPDSLIPDVLAIVRTTKGAIDNPVGELADLAPRLQGNLLQEALAIGREVGDMQALAALIQRLPEQQQEAELTAAVATAQARPPGRNRTRSLDQLAPLLPVSLLPGALAAVRSAGGNGSQAGLLAKLIEYLPEPDRAEAASKAIAAARQTPDAWDRLPALGQLARYLPHDLLAETFELALTDEDPWDLVRELVPYLPEDLLAKALAAARAIPEQSERASALIMLGPRLADGLLSQALQAALHLDNVLDRADFIAAVAEQLPPGELGKALRETAAAAQGLDDVKHVEVLTRLIPHLPEPSREAAVREAEGIIPKIEVPWERGFVLADLIPYLPASSRPAALSDVLAAVDATTGDSSKATLLVKLRSQLSRPQLIDARQLAAEINDGDAEVALEIALITAVPEPERKSMASQALSTLQGAEPGERASWFTELVGTLVQLPRSDLLDLVNQTLPTISRRSLPDAVSDLASLAEILAKLGGAEAAGETVRAVEDVTRWFS